MVKYKSAQCRRINLGNWYAVVWQGKRTEILYIAQATKRFLVDKDGDVDSILMRCLKPKIGSGTTLEHTKTSST